MSGNGNVTIDFGSTLAIDSSLNTMPTLPAVATSSTTGDHVKVTFDWVEGTGGSWKKLFAFKSDSVELTDVAGADDITMDVVVANFYSNNFIADQTNTSFSSGSTTPSNITGGVIAAPAGGDQSIAREYVRYIAEEIFGKANMADLFANEAALVTDVENQHDDNGVGVLTDIKDKLAPTGYETTHANTNPAWLVMTQLLAVGDASGTRFDASGVSLTPVGTDELDSAGASPAGNWHYMPLLADDKLVFSVDFASIPAASHGIGENEVPNRKYKIEITLKD